MKLFLRLFLTSVVLATLWNLTGCATPATSQAMTVKPGTTALLNAKLKGAVSVGAVSGGKDTNPMWTSQVDNAGFKKALADSLAITGYLAGASAPAAYEVMATLEALEQPLFGFTFDVKSKVTYTVKGGGVERSSQRDRHRDDLGRVCRHRALAHCQRALDPGKHQGIHQSVGQAGGLTPRCAAGAAMGDNAGRLSSSQSPSGYRIDSTDPRCE